MQDNGISLRPTKIYPVSQARHVIINRQTPSTNVASSTGGGAKSPGGALGITNSDPELVRLHMNVGEKIEHREKQKEQMNELNDRLADYVEKVRFLDAQNRRLNRELDVLRDRYGRETDHVRAIFQCEVKNLEDLVESSERDKEKTQKELNKIVEDLNSLETGCKELDNENRRNQEIKDRLNQQLADMEGEIALLKRQASAFDNIKGRHKAEIARLRNEENRLKKDLENEIQGKFKAQLEADYLKDVIDATDSTHLMKWQETANLAYRDSTGENREAWSSEFKKKFKNIRATYEERINDVTTEMNESMSLKLRQNIGAVNRDQMEMTMLKQELSTLSNRVNELQNRINNFVFQINQAEAEIQLVENEIALAKKSNSVEIEELQAALAEKRKDCSHAKEELQVFFDMKLSTEVELAAYKKLMESETVSETIDFIDSGKFQSFSEQAEAPRYYSSTHGTYIGSSL